MAHVREAINSGDLVDLVSSGASATVYPNDDTIVQVLQSRFRGDLPCSRVGATHYVVVNPLKTLANVNDTSVKEYEERCYKDTTVYSSVDMPRPLQPHMYDLAARMYLLMRRRGDSQTAIFQGVTGSGKSTSQRLLVNQVLKISAKTKKEHKLAEQIKAFHTFLDSFGNAKTVLNPSASRHSRYLELHFNEKGRISSAKMLAFSLDKSRLTRLSQEERTYHIFYQLLAGAKPEEQDNLGLEDPSDYALLASSGCYRLPGGPFSDDTAAMEELRAALKLLNFKSKHIQSIFSVLVALLLLGNIQFHESPAREESASIANLAVLEHAARLLAVPSEELGQSLVNKSNYVRKELYTVFLGADQAKHQRDSMIQALYSIMFAFMVETANHKIDTANAEDVDILSFLDTPGAQSKNISASLSIGGIAPLIAAHGHNAIDEFTINFSNELIHSYIVRNTFEDEVGYNSFLISDGINLPSVSTMDNSGCVQLLKGSPIPEKVQKKPEGMLGFFHKAATSFKSGKNPVSDEEVLTELVSKYGTHPSFVAAPAAGAPGFGANEKTLFGINHYTGTCTYDISGFIERNADLVDPALVSILRESKDSFISKLFSGPGMATERHSMDETIVVQAQVSSRPLRAQSSLPSSNGPGPSLDDLPTLDPSKCYPITSQVNFTLSAILFSLQSSKPWTISCIRPNDSGSPNSFDKRRVKMQVRALLLPDLIARRRNEYVADYEHAAFCDRYAPSMQGSVQDRLQHLTQANGWRSGTDYVMGHRSIWLSYLAWKSAEDALREKEKAANPPDEEESVFHQDPDDELQPPGRPWKSGNPFSDSDDNLLVNRVAADGSKVQDPNNPYSATSPNTPYLQTPGAARDDDSMWGSEYDKKRDLSPAQSDAALEKETGFARKETQMSAVEEVPTSRARRWWLRLVWFCTWWIPSFLLIYIGRMKRPDIRLAWREKVTICILIFLLCGTVIFYIVIFGRLLCPNFEKAWTPREVATHTGDDDFWVALHGQVYDISSFWRRDHSDIINSPVTSDVMQALAGQDLTGYFPPPLVLACPDLVTDETMKLQYRNFTPEFPGALHVSGFQQPFGSSALRDPQWYVKQFLPTLRQWHKGPLVYSMKEIHTAGVNGSRSWAVWENGIYDLTDYFYTISQNPNQKDELSFMNSTLTDIWERSAGKDITKELNELMSKMPPLEAAKHNACLKNTFFIGEPDFRQTARCQVQNYFLLAASIILVTTIAAKFLAALQLSGKRNPEMLDKFVICQVPCYTEGEESLRRTIDSLAALKYDDKRKLLFIICDGNIIGSGNDRPTPRIVLDILGVDPKLDPEPLLFKSVGEGSLQLNYGKVYSGLYEFEGHVVPYMVIVKTGKPTERSKPGNRGKRDSQILLLHYLNRVHFDAPMSPLELEIYHQMRNVIGIDPAFYEYIFTVDADTSVTPDSLNRLVACAADDSKIIGICGETKVDNEEGSWWTMIQVYEYYISHHLAKAFESLFGSVTCLPGCFSMFRIRTADKGRPIIISNRIIDEYAENNVDTLHKKNLLSLGEDRYLTTLLMKNFPTYKLKFTPDAVAHTVAPDRWSILLSQRRRWINSTIHNLCELVFLPELCGFCCFSMRFIVFLDLLGTIILPATTVYLVYLIVVVSSGKAAIPILSLVMIGAVYGLQALIFILKREFMLVGWMIVYILSYPVYSFFLPIYSFWCMDDFSWGNTRLVIGEGSNKKVIMNDDLKFDESMIPLKKFSEYEAEAWESHTHQDHGSDDTRSAAPSRKSRQQALSEAQNSYQAASQAGDYYRDTNLTNHSSANPGIAHSRLPSVQSMSQPHLPLTGYNPSMSFMGPMFPTGPPSVASSGGGAFGGPSPLGMGHMGSFGSPGMFPMGMGMPGAPRNTIMSSMNFFGGPGSIAGSGLGGMPPSMTAPPQMPQMNPQTRFSTMSLGTALNPFAAGPSQNPDPDDEELLNVLRAYLSTQDLMTVTKKTAREAVMSHFPNANLAPKREFLNKSIDDILASG